MAKGKPSYYLKDPLSTEDTLILFSLRVPDKNKPLKRSIGKKVNPAVWLTVDQRADAGKIKPLQEINRLLDNITEAMDAVKSDCRRNNRLVMSADVDAALNIILQNVRRKRAIQNSPGHDMMADYKKVIELMRSGDILIEKTKKRYSDNTMKNYERLVRDLTRFYIEKKITPSYAGIDLRLYNTFLTWCHQQKWANNSSGTVIKCWKNMLKITNKQGWHANKIYKEEEFLTLREETPDIYLDQKKIDKLYKQNNPEEYHNIARDWGVLDCFLGLRISDLQNVTIDDFGGKYFQFVNQKTGAKVAIPIHPYVKAIIKKYKGMPPAISDQKLNEYIKVVAKRAGLKDKFIYTVTKGGVLEKTVYEEWEMLSTHTFRRTFITNLLEDGVPDNQVMQLAGIKKHATLMRYKKTTPERGAENAARLKFFKGR